MKIKVLSSAFTHPPQAVSSLEIDQHLHLPPQTTQQRSGVGERFWSSEKNSDITMARNAMRQALSRAKLQWKDIDTVICASSIRVQLLPSSACIYIADIPDTDHIDAFDIHASCLGFLKALDILFKSSSIGKKTLVVNSEWTSIGIRPEAPEPYSLFGDGATAFIFETCPDNVSGYSLLASCFRSDADSWQASQCRGGGTRTHPAHSKNDIDYSSFFFEMNGPQLYKQAARNLPPTLHRSLKDSGLSLHQIAAIYPHTGSQKGFERIARRLSLPLDRVHSSLPHYGNLVSASIPAAWHLHRSQEQSSHPAQPLLFIGVAAGISLASMVIDYG